MKAFLVVLLLVISAVTIHCQTTPCGTFTCGGSDKCCVDVVIGSVCFNPANYDCVPVFGITSGSAPSKLCGKGEGACTLLPLFGSPVACYSPATHDCIIPQGGLVSFRRALCGKGLQFCGFSGGCFDPTRYRCCRQDFICRIGEPGCC